MNDKMTSSIKRKAEIDEIKTAKRQSIYGIQGMYRVIRVKLENCRWLFETENIDSFLIKWYFYYCKGGKFYTVPQNFRKKSH